jgi:Skp family chaperone for outer membrane proteins
MVAIRSSRIAYFFPATALLVIGLFVIESASQFSTFVSPAVAETRIATVDVARLLNESPEASAKKKELEAKTQKAKAQADVKLKALKALETKLKDAKVAVDSKEAESFRNQARDYERFMKDTEEDIKKQYVKINKIITDKALDRVTRYAKANKIDLVLDKSEKYRGPVLFGTDDTDITSSIIEESDE